MVGPDQRGGLLLTRRHLRFPRPVAQALAARQPVVALETAVLTHGLPAPANLETALAMEAAVREAGAVPATVGLLDGTAVVGLTEQEMRRLATEPDARKASIRDLPMAVARRWSAGTTVAATAALAHAAGIEVFVTGGIGGVHHQGGATFDISADLPVLASVPLVVVCAGAKTILDLPATLEWLETAGVPVVGYGADEFPGFFVRQTGLPLAARVDTPAEVVAITLAQRELGLPQALVLAVPAPAETALAGEATEAMLAAALAELANRRLPGRDVTPFLLGELGRRSGGATLTANIALLLNNARVGAAVAVALASAARTA